MNANTKLALVIALLLGLMLYVFAGVLFILFVPALVGLLFKKR